MTLNDIKIATLQLMFTNYSDDIRTADVDEMTNEEYLQYVVNMDSSINRCLGRFESAGVLPSATKVITSEDGATEGFYTKYDLGVLASDCNEIQRVIHESGNNLASTVSYTMVGNTIILPRLENGGTYTIVYSKRAKRIPIGAVSSTEIEVPQHLADIMPYFIKAELFEEDEPALANQARNIFEASLSAFTRKETYGATGVVNLYGGLQ